MSFLFRVAEIAAANIAAGVIGKASEKALDRGVEAWQRYRGRTPEVVETTAEVLDTIKRENKDKR